jgi:hypothetical protein
MTHQKKQALNCRSRLMPWPWLCGLLGLALVPAMMATDPLYENDSVLNYTVPPDNLPAIDATNFLNNNWFQIAFTTTAGGLNVNAETYETENTVNYTNIGTMVANSSILINSSGLELELNPSCGFNFDTYNTQSGLEQMAGSFYNPGQIYANSSVNLGANALLVSTVGKCLVNASNIVNPGTIDLGENSLMRLTGKNVDLTRGTLIVEGFGAVSALTAGFGLDTNREWNPGIDLTSSSALPSLVRIALIGNVALWSLPPGYPSYPVPTTPYVSVIQTATNNFIYQYAFVDNAISNVTANVFVSSFLDFCVVEFVGSYTDPVTGLPANNYLYLEDDYVVGAANPGINVANGVPGNFFFIPSPTPLFPGLPPDAPGFLPLPNLAISNAYSYVDVQLIPTTVATNNPTTQQNVTNYLSQVLPGRIQISAENNLDLSLAQISGQNYLSLLAPTQFNGSVGAHIASPYSDINLGVTNGLMSITNLMEPWVPTWSGGIQAWSTRFIVLSTNSTIVFSNGLPVLTNSFAVSNDFRVLIVAAEAAATSPSEIQDLRLHCTTNLVISDVLNILRSVSIDAQNLTLTTNGPNTASPDGELNMQLLPTTPTTPVNYAFVWANAFPNLQNLTNWGAVRMPNVNPVNMGSSASPYGAFINHGLISDYGAIIYAANFESDGIFSNSVLGSFVLRSQTATLTNGLLYAGGDVSITTGSLVTSNVFLQANRSLTLTATNLLTDRGSTNLLPIVVTNANNWVVGSNSIGNGFSLPIKPVAGDLLGTTVTLFAPLNKKVVNTWAGGDLGISNAGYTNNVAIGRLVLDALGSAAGTQFYFSGTGASNAIYVDRLELLDYASYTNHNAGGNLPALVINTNLVIYYADAIAAGAGFGGTSADVSRQLDHKNNDHLRWVPTYAGYFSSTNLVFAGVTNTVNAALAGDTFIDSNGNGIANAYDPTPFFLPSMVNQTGSSSPPFVIVSWNTIPLATNFVFYSTNQNDLKSFTNIASQFISPMPYPGPVANISTNYLMVTPPALPLYYRVMVSPWTTYPY